MNHKVFFNMTEDYSEGYFILLYSVARLSLILFSPQRWHIALSKSESLPAQRDGKFTVGLTQILLTGVFGIFNSDRDPFVVVTFKGCKKLIQLNLCYCEEKKKNPYFENLGAWICWNVSFFSEHKHLSFVLWMLLLTRPLTTLAWWNWSNYP